MIELPAFVVVIACLALAILTYNFYTLNVRLKEKEKTFEQTLENRYSYWRSNELERERKTIEFSMRSHFQGELEQWKIQNENHFRQDAIKRSKAVIIGKVTEHVAPYFTDFPYNPKEVRFIGTPIDLIVFKNIESEDDEVEVHFVEIKTNNSSLSLKQRLIRDAVYSGRVHWRELRIDT